MAERAILWVSLQVKTTEKVEITFGIPKQTEINRISILFGVSQFKICGIFDYYPKEQKF